MADQTQTGSLVAKAAEGYAAQITLRALFQAIPYVGGSIDTLFAGKGQKIQQARVEQFLKELDERVRRLPAVHAPIPEDQLLDLMIGATARITTSSKACGIRSARTYQRRLRSTDGGCRQRPRQSTSSIR